MEQTKKHTMMTTTFSKSHDSQLSSAGIPSPVRWCSLAFWASKYSLKGFCSAAPSSGTALFPPTGVWGLVVVEEEEKEWGEGV